MDPAQASGWLPRRPEPAEPQRTQVQAKAKAKRSFRKEIREDERLDFGKHKGKTFKEALQADLYYAIWCSQVNEQSLPMRRFLQYAEDRIRAWFSPSVPRWRPSQREARPPSPFRWQRLTASPSHLRRFRCTVHLSRMAAQRRCIQRQCCLSNKFIKNCFNSRQRRRSLNPSHAIPLNRARHL
eukprot:g18581.t1